MEWPVRYWSKFSYYNSSFESLLVELWIFAVFRFWSRQGFVPMYLRQTANDLTGEHSCIMLKALSHQDVSEEYGTPDPKANWIGAYYKGNTWRNLNTKYSNPINIWVLDHHVDLFWQNMSSSYLLQEFICGVCLSFEHSVAHVSFVHACHSLL